MTAAPSSPNPWTRSPAPVAGFLTYITDIHALGLPVDTREYGIGAQILADLGVSPMRLMTNNPAKYTGLEGYGLRITEHVPLAPTITAENLRYLRTRRERMGHHLEGLDTYPQPTPPATSGGTAG